MEHQGTNPLVRGWYFGDFNFDGATNADDAPSQAYAMQQFGPGSSQNTALLPTSNINGVMTFSNAPSMTWLDPPVSSIVEYDMSASEKFVQIMNFPEGFGPLEVLVDGESVGSFAAGDSYIFPGSGVESFAIRGIDPTVDMEDGTAFPL